MKPFISRSCKGHQPTEKATRGWCANLAQNGGFIVLSAFPAPWVTLAEVFREVNLSRIVLTPNSLFSGASGSPPLSELGVLSFSKLSVAFQSLEKVNSAQVSRRQLLAGEDRVLVPPACLSFTDVP